MNKIFVSIALLMIMCNSVASACDACGCSMKGIGFNLLSPYKKSYFSLRYSNAPFQSIVASSDGSKDMFNQVEATGRYGLNQKVYFQASLPFVFNKRISSLDDQSKIGWGDGRISAHYIFFNQAEQSTNRNYYVDGGMGVKTSFGSYDAELHDSYQLPENFNPGNGSWAIFIQSNQMANFSSFGLVFSQYYMHNFKTPESYKFGNQLTFQVLSFYQKELSPKVSMTPFIGLGEELVFQDKKANGKYANATGGQSLFASFGLNLRFDQVIVGALFSLPTIQNISNNEVEAQKRTTVQFSYLFN